MDELESKAPDVHAELFKGKFTAQKSSLQFSSLALDQVHEQNSKLIKGEGGAVGLFDNEAALRRWMVSGTMMSHILSEFGDDV